MGSRAGSSLPFLIVSHEAVVVRAEEWLTMKKDSRYGDNFAEKRERGGVRIVRLEKGESSSSVAGPLASSAAAAAKLLDVEMMSEETSHPLSPSYKLDDIDRDGCSDQGVNHAIERPLAILSALLEETLVNFREQYELYLRTAECLRILCEHRTERSFPKDLAAEPVIILGMPQSLTTATGSARAILHDYKSGMLDLLIKTNQAELDYYMDCLACAPAVLEEKVNSCFPSAMITEDEADKALADDMINLRKEWNNRVVDEFSDKALSVQIDVASLYSDTSIRIVADLLKKRREEERLALMPLQDRIWSGLPEDLIDRTLACLPVPSFFRFRSVCKRWNTLLKTNPFLELWSTVVSQQLWLFSIHVKHPSEMVAMAYSPSLGIWHTVPVPQYLSKMYTLASAGGLLCSAAYTNRLAVVCVCNPLTTQWKHLPSMLYIKRVHLLGMVVDKVTRHYKIVVVGTQSRQDLVSNTEVYESATGSWEITGRALGSFTSHRLVYCNGLFYNLSATRGWPVTLILHAYDIGQQSWREEIRSAMLLNFQAPPSLVECQGSLLIVGRISEDSHFAKPKAIRLWELREKETGGEWVEVVTMPPALLEEFCKEWTRPTHFRCRGLGSVIYFLSSRALMYDLSQKVWQWLPNGPGYHYDHVLPFEPRLDGLV
ncbi:F-box/kelch-repeat protein At5g15710 [Physcomitrium patens]|uniref:F-box domain-containing protein n=1 Tax=Physcomitrium patens TaxID=3218 RepID=A0A2K1K414_PHYPA|nr:F-box/kelch-repeat protein At5g15710-like [Physcomitrium patens]PNR48523.1 hypothetical protein PHYPA_013000 [Physcomitrium patens]|eukprot:XP_024384400.1 F-box/kelch-repeat protein At5g15710-like [Physcomitrella patens]